MFVLLINRLTSGLGLVGTLGLLAMMIHVTADVIARTFWSVSIPATLEIVTRYYMITLTLLPLGWVEWSGKMIKVDIFTDIIGRNAIRYTDTLVALFSALVYVMFTQATWIKAMEQFELGAYVMSLDVAIPVWPTYFVLPVSFALAAFVCLARIPLFFTKTPNAF